VSEEKFPGGRVTEKKTENSKTDRKIALLSFFQGGGATEKITKNSKKTLKT